MDQISPTRFAINAALSAFQPHVIAYELSRQFVAVTEYQVVRLFTGKKNLDKSAWPDSVQDGGKFLRWAVATGVAIVVGTWATRQLTGDSVPSQTVMWLEIGGLVTQFGIPIIREINQYEFRSPIKKKQAY